MSSGSSETEGPRLAAGLALAAIAAGTVEWGGGRGPRGDGERAARGREVGARQADQGRPDRGPVGEHVVLVVGVIHGDERAGLRIIDALRRRVADPATLQGKQLWLIPSVSPDGMRMRTRKNARGVDLNRNFPFRAAKCAVERLLPGSPAGLRARDQGGDRVCPSDPARSVGLVPPAVGRRPGVSREAATRRGIRNLVGMRTSCRGKGLRGTAISWEAHSFPGSTAFVVGSGRAGSAAGPPIATRQRF